MFEKFHFVIDSNVKIFAAAMEEEKLSGGLKRNIVDEKDNITKPKKRQRLKLSVLSLEPDYDWLSTSKNTGWQILYKVASNELSIILST